MAKRNLSRFNAFDIHTYTSIDEFLAADVHEGISTISYKGLPLDLLNVNRGSRSTLIMFHSALSNNMQTLPVFSGQRLAERLNMNLLSISDPSLGMDESLRLTWFMGNRRQPLMEDLPHVLSHVVRSHHFSRPIFFGASGGGFAALLYSRNVENAITVVANPRIDLSQSPNPNLAPYLKHCFNAVGTTPAVRVMRDNMVMQLQADYAKGHVNDIIYLQNVKDAFFLAKNMRPFIDARRGSGTLWLLLDDYGVGHKPVPTEVLESVLRNVKAASSWVGSGPDELRLRKNPSVVDVDVWVDDLMSR